MTELIPMVPMESQHSVGMPTSCDFLRSVFILEKSRTEAARSRQITTPAPHHSVFTGRMLFLMPNQQY